MSFITLLEKYQDLDFETFFANVTSDQVERAIHSLQPTELDFLTLLSPGAAYRLEEMARRAHDLTVQFFGRTIQMFIPIYISNYCSNHCVYCGFHRGNRISRRKLSLAEIESEARSIAATGMRHVLMLTGESPAHTPPEYLVEATRLLKRYFASVSVEIFPLEEEGYRSLKNAGADGLTLYQEVYDQKIYQQVHLAGRKADYRFRLDGPERGARAGLRAVNIGPLLGLGEPRKEVFLAGLHANYLTRKYLQTEIGLSLPRMNPAEGDFTPPAPVDDRMFVQFMLALRCFLPRVGLTISTRERADFRDHLIPLGVTRFSAGSCTGVGGYVETKEGDVPQFEITDDRSVEQVAAAVVAAGYQPIYKDWDLI
ncbi:2-iminoacetate synthase ThiH [Desulfopila aestuarii]|uniref:Tyrosine lyase ThiH n=1 Tax=Desulfopila aestuarii DSM 18488 TaxID=1121416 RepID=A0A1M7Y8Y0_9BACT|nr:2-iminoacetate synthase ThiH [Desulfopila aestuarii]SHO49095.1 tyrosine lyase ThiH [Desulfopila aestuarii DSM 18488]